MTDSGPTMKRFIERRFMLEQSYGVLQSARQYGAGGPSQFQQCCYHARSGQSLTARIPHRSGRQPPAHFLFNNTPTNSDKPAVADARWTNRLAGTTGKAPVKMQLRLLRH